MRQLFDLSVRLKVFHPSGGGKQPGFACRFSGEAGPFIGWKVRSNNDGPQYWVSELANIPELPDYLDIKSRLIEIGRRLNIEINDKNELKINLEDLTQNLIEEIENISGAFIKISEMNN